MISPKRLLKSIISLREKSLVNDSSWMLLNKFLSSVIQVGYFIFVARYLGSKNYGLFEGTKAIWGIIFPFVGLGMGNILIQYVSRDASQFSKTWGDTLLSYFLSFLVTLVVIFPCVAILFKSTPVLFILLVLLGDLVGLKLCGLANSAFIANHQVKQASVYGMLYVVSKFIAAMFLPLFPEDARLIAWGFLYCIGSIIPAIILLWMIQKRFGKPVFNFKSLDINNLKQGFYFSLSDSAGRINSQMDKTMLVVLATPEAAGLYSAGYRFIDMGYLPIFAIQGASYARFFQYGEEGLKGTLRFARTLLPFIIGYGLFTLIALAAFSPLVPRLLGDEFAESGSVLIWLSSVHLMYGLQYLASDSLTGAGFQRSRSFVQVGAALLNIGLNLYLIPLYSWRGAIWATLASEILKVVLLWLIVFFLRRREIRGAVV